MKTQKKRNTLAQNSIDYIVYSNPVSVRQLLYDRGYEPPRNARELVQATKELIRKKGNSVITELLAIHPDKKAILSVSASTSKSNCNACNYDGYNQKDNFCGSCGHSNYIGLGDEDSFLDQFTDTSDRELQKYYERIVRKSNAAPKDKQLSGEVQTVWNELRQRKLVLKEDPPEAPISEKKMFLKKDEMILIAVVFTAGFLVGSGYKIT